MKIGIVQFNPIFGKKEKNISTAHRLISSINADLIVLPELFSTGYLFLENDNMSQIAESFDGTTINQMMSIAKQEGKAIVGGFAEKFGNTFYNSQFFVSPEGQKFLYRKIHLFDKEKLFFQKGNLKPELIQWHDIKIGMLVCFDWIFPEIYRTYALAGADLICHSANLVLPYSQKASFARAIENRIYIALANRTGTENRGEHSLRFTGQSIAYSPRGDVLFQAAPNLQESTGFFKLDTKLSRDKNITERNHLFMDRRPEMYKL